jgi:hypothetical protein
MELSQHLYRKTKELGLTAIEWEDMMREEIRFHLQEQVAIFFEMLDNSLFHEKRAEGYTTEKKTERTISFRFAEVTFRRRRLVHKQTREALYPLDEFLNIAPRQRISEGLKETVSTICAKGMYQKTMEIMEEVSYSRISASTANRIVKEIEEREKILAEIEKEEKELSNEEPEKRKVDYLCIEGDGLVLGCQMKEFHLELHRFQIHEGVRYNGKRTELINPVLFSDFSRKKAFEKVLMYIHEHYDITETVITTNSDMGSGYGFETFSELALGCKRHEHFVDKFHWQKKIRERLRFQKDYIYDVYKACIDYDWEKVDIELKSAKSENLIEAQREEIDLLRAYLERNWAYMKPALLRGLTDKQCGYGSCESLHRPYSYRMKHQGRTWLLKGASAMVHVIDRLRNGTLRNLFRFNFRTYKKLKKKKEKEFETDAWKVYPHEEHQIPQAKIPNFGSTQTALGKLKSAL